MAAQLSNLTAAEFRSALAKGLGRAVLHTTERPLESEHLSALVEAFLEPSDWFNADDEHVPWLMALVDVAGARGEVTSKALAASRDECDERRLDRICSVLRELAVGGAPEAKDALYAVVRRSLRADDLVPGWTDVLALDGPQAFVAVAGDVLGDVRLTHSLVERGDEASRRATAESIDRLALTEGARQTLRKALDEAAAATTAPKKDRQGWLRTLSATDVLDAAKANTCGWFRGWARIASDPDLLAVAESMFTEGSDEILRRLLLVFTARPLPTFDARLLGLAERDDQSVKERLLQVLARYAHPKVRELALARLRDGFHDGGTIGLLECNYATGDHERLVPLFADPSAPDVMHDRGAALIGVFERNPLIELSPLVEIIYEAIPCSMCREKAVKRLLEARFAADWMIEECEHDAFERIRTLVLNTREARPDAP
jgi:hypothetical protein